ncbi:MAG: hypothetical protein EBT38_05480, partial [Acidimicrobiia bacterium]|nr:hypothetical protein [Acidimicrobiia bacterium]
MWIAIPLSALLVAAGLLLRRTILLAKDLRVLERMLDSLASDEISGVTVASFSSKQLIERIAPRLERLVWRHEFLRDRIRHEEFSLNTILSSMELRWTLV